MSENVNFRRKIKPLKRSYEGEFHADGTIKTFNLEQTFPGGIRTKLMLNKRPGLDERVIFTVYHENGNGPVPLARYVIGCCGHKNFVKLSDEYNKEPKRGRHGLRVCLVYRDTIDHPLLPKAEVLIKKYQNKSGMVRWSVADIPARPPAVVPDKPIQEQPSLT